MSQNTSCRLLLLLLLLLLLAVMSAVSTSPARTFAEERDGAPPRPQRVGDRLWLWAHPAGVYNGSFLADLGRESRIEPVDAARLMGLRNVYFIHYDGQPRPPLGGYFEPFKALDKVVWSLTGASGATSEELRDEVLRLAADQPNVTGFVLDDFFHAPAAGPPAAAEQAQWLADNNPAFPVTVTLTPPAPVACDALELAQSRWRTGDYRTKAFEVEVSADGSAWRRAAGGELPNEPGAAVRVRLEPGGRFAGLRVRVLSTHDTAGALSCGLTRVRAFDGDRPLDTGGWKAEASSAFPGHPAANAVATPESKAAVQPFDASLTTEQLRGLRGRATARGRRLPINAVVYTAQISPRAAAHLAEVDEVSLWTWAPADLEDLEANLSALERLAPGKPVVLGCYMFDFSANKPLPVEPMKRQVELGYRWLREGRVTGMIFLASPVCDLDLEAVEWTRRWVAEVGDLPLEQPAAVRDGSTGGAAPAGGLRRP